MQGADEDSGIALLPVPFVLLEDRSEAGGPALLFSDPVETVSATEIDEVPAAFTGIEAGLARGLHAAGFLSYELGYAFEPRLRPLIPGGRILPLLCFGLFEAPRPAGAAVLDREFAARGAPPPLENLAMGLDEQGHAGSMQRVLDYLRAGDAYQVNLTFPIRFRYPGDPLALYAALRASQPVAYGGIVAMADATILSVSPELFIETAAGHAVTRPMKGTVARGGDTESDEAAKLALRADPKQRAENLMIVDLLRNDLGHVSELGSVAVPALYSTETYPGFHALTSTVTSRLQPGLPLSGLVQAMFPCGSVTGAPKLRAMQIIRELEPQPREIYTGSLGMIAPNGDCRFNVAIRTVTIRADGEGVYSVGGGIVADSVAADEYEECRLKARVLTDLAGDYGLFETLRWSAGCGFTRLPLHLERLGAAAESLGFRFDRAGIETRLAALERDFAGTEAQRVRFELRRNGELLLANLPMPPGPEGETCVAVCDWRVDAGDPFLRYKTTRRQVFESALTVAATLGCDDAILLNRQGFVTESTRGNVFLERDGLLLTPPIEHGLLPGVLRRELLETGRAREAALRLPDLQQAQHWFIGNSLRGLRAARLRPSDTALASRAADRE